MTNYKINSAPFRDQRRLLVSIEKALLRQNLDLADIEINLDDLTKIDMGSVDAISRVIFAIDSDEGFEKALFNCLERSLYKEEKITYETFENEEAKELYYPIVIECLKVNITPFFCLLPSKLREIFGKNTDTLKQK